MLLTAVASFWGQLCLWGISFLGEPSGMSFHLENSVVGFWNERWVSTPIEASIDDRTEPFPQNFCGAYPVTLIRIKPSMKMILSILMLF